MVSGCMIKVVPRSAPGDGRHKPPRTLKANVRSLGLVGLRATPPNDAQRKLGVREHACTAYNATRPTTKYVISNIVVLLIIGNYWY